MRVVERIDPFHQAEDALVVVRRTQRGEVEAREEQFLHFLVVVVRHLALDDGVNGLRYGIIVEMRLIFRQGSVVLAGLMEVFAVFVVCRRVFASLAVTFVIVAAVVPVLLFAVAALIVVMMVPAVTFMFVVLFHHALIV